MLSDYREASSGGSRARFLFANMQQRLFSSIAAFDRTLRTHRSSLERADVIATAGAEEDARDDAEDNGEIVAATRRAITEVSDIQAAIERVDAMLAITGLARSRPDARVERLIDWLMEYAVGADGTWRDRRLIIFTEWEDTRRWLVERLGEGILRRTKGKADLHARVEILNGHTRPDERERIKQEFNAPYDIAPVRILVCTDAAREGINLQARCSDLVHFDLPWNPSRLEQRNGRIDRKLQPAKTVTCRYFVYTQREEDRVLDALMKKTETIRRQLGSAGEVLGHRLEDRLKRDGIRRSEAATVAREIDAAELANADSARCTLDGVDTERLERLKREQDGLGRDLEYAQRRVGVAGEDLRSVIELALGRDGVALTPGAFSVKEAVRLPVEHPTFARDTAWTSLFDELRRRPPNGQDVLRWRRETAVRGLVFEPPSIADGEPEPQDVVQLHLEHRLVKRLIGRFVSQGFRETVGRVAAIVIDLPRPRVVLLGRLALFGPGARRLHEAIIPVAAQWTDTGRMKPLEPFGETGEATTVDELHKALRQGREPNEAVKARLGAMLERDIADLRPHVEARAAVSEVDAKRRLAENGRQEADAMRVLLERQAARVAAAMTVAEQPLQASFDFLTEEQRAQAAKEQAQRDRDRSTWEGKLARLTRDIAEEPLRVVDGYRVLARRLEPVGLVYLWPRTN